MLRIILKWQGLFGFISVFILASFSFAVNKVDDTGYYGSITYNPSGVRTSYTLFYFSQKMPKRKIREEYLDVKGTLLGYKTIQYDKHKLTVVDYNQLRKAIKTTTMHYNANGSLKKLTIKDPRKELLHQIVYDYGFYEGKELYQTERYFYGDDLGDNYYYLKKKLVFNHKSKYEKWVEYFIKTPKSDKKQYTLAAIVIFKYNDSTNIDTITYLDNNRRLHKYIQYYYDQSSRLTKIATFQKTELGYLSDQQTNKNGNFHKMTLSSYIVLYTQADADKFPNYKKEPPPKSTKKDKVITEKVDKLDKKMDRIEAKLNRLEKDVTQMKTVDKSPEEGETEEGESEEGESEEGESEEDETEEDETEEGESEEDETEEGESEEGESEEGESEEGESEEDETEENETEENETEENETKEDETKEDETKEDETKEDETKKDETKKDETKKDETKEE